MRAWLATVAELLGRHDQARLGEVIGMVSSPQAVSRLVRSKRARLRLTKIVARRLQWPDPVSPECASAMAFLADHGDDVADTTALIGLTGAFAAFGPVLLKSDLRRISDSFGSAAVAAALHYRGLAPPLHGATPASVIENPYALVGHGAPLFRAWARLKFAAAGAWVAAGLPAAQADCRISPEQAAAIDRLIGLTRRRPQVTATMKVAA
jgi:hypothetical protein